MPRATAVASLGTRTPHAPRAVQRARSEASCGLAQANANVIIAGDAISRGRQRTTTEHEAWGRRVIRGGQCTQPKVVAGIYGHIVQRALRGQQGRKPGVAASAHHGRVSESMATKDSRQSSNSPANASWAWRRHA